MTAGDGLARVTYLPGVQPPPEPAVDLSRAFDLDDERQGAHRSEATAGGSATDTAGRSATDDGEANDGEANDGETNVESEPKRDALGRTKREVRAENVSMHALSRRWLSRWEMEKLLRDREFTDDVVQAELERLEGVELIDDSRVAASVVRDARERKGLGRAAIVAELRRRHIAEEHFELAFAELNSGDDDYDPDEDEQQRANEIALKRAGQLSSYDSETAKRRLTAFMMRRGYSSSIVREAVDQAMRGSGTGGVRFR